MQTGSVLNSAKKLHQDWILICVKW